MIKRMTLAALALLAMHAAIGAELKGWVLQDEDYPEYQGVKQFFEQVKARTNGKFDGRIVGQAEVGNQKKALPLFKKGDLDIAVLSDAPLNEAVPALEVLGLPFIFDNTAHMLRTLDGEVGQDIEKSLMAKGYIVVGWYDGGARSIFLRSKPSGTAMDLNAKRIRIANRKVLRQMCNSLGAQPVDIPYDKVDEALQDGEIDGAENDLLSYELSSQYKYAPYFMVSNHSVRPEALVVSVKLWNSLSPAERQVFRDAGHASAVAMRALWQQKLASVRTKLEKEGVKFVDVKNNTSFISRMRQVYAPVLKNPDAGALMLRIMTLRT